MYIPVERKPGAYGYKDWPCEDEIQQANLGCYDCLCSVRVFKKATEEVIAGRPNCRTEIPRPQTKREDVDHSYHRSESNP